MQSQERDAHRSCRLFVLAMLGTVVLAFVLILGLFHRHFVVTHRQVPITREQRR
jgi:hypothetical protein